MNYECKICGDVFGSIKQVRPHLSRAHGASTGDWAATIDPVTRAGPNRAAASAKKAAKAINKTLIGPFKCLHCGFTAVGRRGVAAHIGHVHKKGGYPKIPAIAGVDFEALGSPQHWNPVGMRGRPPQKPKQSVGSRITAALTSGEPTIDVEFELTPDITIRVPLTLGPPVFIERNGND